MENLNEKNINNIDPNDEDINFKSILSFFNRSKNLILGVVFTSTFVTSLYAFNAKPKWSGSFNIVVKNESSNSSPENILGSYGAIFGNVTNNDEYETQRLILKSPSVLMPVFDFVKNYYQENNLNVDKFFFKKWVEKNLDINFENKSSVLKVEYINQDKKLILKTLELISSKYQDYSKSDTEKQITKTIEYLNQQIKLMSEKSLKSTKIFNEFSIKNGLGSIDGFVSFGDPTSLSGYTSIFQKDSKQEAKQDIIKQKNFIDRKKSQSDAGIRFQNQFSLLEKYEAEFVDYSSKLKPNSNTLKELKSRIDNLRMALKRPNEILIDYRRLNSEALRDDAILQELKNSLQVLKLNKIKTPVPWEMISVPTIDNKPVFPQKEKLIFFGFLISFFIASLISLIKEKLSSKIFELDEYQKYINYEYLDTLYKNKKQINENILKNVIELNQKIAVINLSDNFMKNEVKEDFKFSIDLEYIEFISFKDIKELSSFKNIILITEEGVITKENLNLIDKYLLPYKKQIKGWFYFT